MTFLAQTLLTIGTSTLVIVGLIIIREAQYDYKAGIVPSVTENAVIWAITAAIALIATGVFLILVQ